MTLLDIIKSCNHHILSVISFRTYLGNIKSGFPLSPPKKAARRVAFFGVRERDENPGVRYRAALSRRSRERLPLSPPKKSSPQGCFFCVRERGMRTPGFVIAQRFRGVAEKDSLSLRKARLKRLCQNRRRRYKGIFDGYGIGS